MERVMSGFRVGRTVMVVATAALLLATFWGAVGAGPDEPKSETVVTKWDIFEGHAFTTGRLTPTGYPVVACLGGCDTGYVSDPVSVGIDGRYGGLRVGRSASERATGADGDVVTFWLVGEEDWVRADQAVLFLGNSQVRKLHLSFAAFPAVSDAPEVAVEPEPVDDGPKWQTTDLTLPDTPELGLVPNDSAQAFAATTVRYAGLPLLPGFGVALGLLLMVIGVSLLIYRRRIIW